MLFNYQLQNPVRNSFLATMIIFIFLHKLYHVILLTQFIFHILILLMVISDLKE